MKLSSGKVVVAFFGMVASLVQAYQEVMPDYSVGGDNWSDTIEGAELCSEGKEQSPIDLSLIEIEVSDKMELNGYGYTDFTVVKDAIGMPTHRVNVNDGEFIQNLHDGKK